MAGDSRKIDQSQGIILLIIGLLTYFFLTQYFRFIQDDAWITFRYAQNYLNGHGLVYNIGERIEGYTNFLWTLIIIIGAQLGIKMPVVAHWLGVLSGALTIIMMYRLTQTYFETTFGSHPHLIAGISAIILGSCYSFSYWAVSGLETALFTLLVLTTYYFYIKRSFLLIPMLVAATLTRPEGLLFFILIIILESTSKNQKRTLLLPTLIFYIAFLTPYGLFKLFYYHSLLPNTFYAKTGLSLAQLNHGVEYIITYFSHYWGYGLFLIPGIIALYKKPKTVRPLAIIVLLYLAYILMIGGDVLKVHRFFVPLMPFLILFSLYGLLRITNRMLIIIPSLLLVIAWQLYMPYNYVQTYLFNERGLAIKIETVVSRLQRVDRSNFSFAISTIGLAGYKLIGHDVIDLLGLTDSTIARHPEPPIENLTSSWRESKYNSQYLLSRQPDYIMFSTGFKPSAPAERALFLYSDFLKSYRTISFHFGNHLHPIFKRYRDIAPPIIKDVPVEMVENLNQGINLLWNKKDYPAALASFEKALSFSPFLPHGYPYIRHYMSIAYLFAGDFESSYNSLRIIVDQDSLVFDAYKDLYRYEYRLGNFEQAKIYRSHAARLAPWHLPRMDSLVRRQTP